MLDVTAEPVFSGLLVQQVPKIKVRWGKLAYYGHFKSCVKWKKCNGWKDPMSLKAVLCSFFFYLSDAFVADGSRVSAATVASTAIAAAQWAVTQVTCQIYDRLKQSICILRFQIIFVPLYLHIWLCKDKSTRYLFLSQNAQKGSSGGQSVDASSYQQGAAVTYSQEGLEYTGPDSTTFKAHADGGVAALTSVGASLNGAYAGGAAPG